MSVDLRTLNELPGPQAEQELLRCCGSRAWASRMLAARPFADQSQLFSAADRSWKELSREDRLEAFSHHPRIGDLKSLRAKFQNPDPRARQWATQEQQGAANASEETLTSLAEGNAAYEKRFGFVFLVCASGKTAEEMLAILQSRIGNDPAQEIQIAAAEQAKITRIRLEKLLS